MRTATYNVNVASNRRRRENVPWHILCSFTGKQVSKNASSLTRRFCVSANRYIGTGLLWADSSGAIERDRIISRSAADGRIVAFRTMNLRS